MRTGTVLPESFLRLMSKEDRAKLGTGGITAAEAASKSQIRNERHLQSLIVNLLRLKGIEVLWHRTDKRSAATVGWPDLTFCVKTGEYGFQTFFYPCLWEVKMPKCKLSPEQEALRPKLQENGWRWRLISSVDEALAELKAMGIE